MFRITLKKFYCFLLLLPIFRFSSIISSPIILRFFSLYTYVAIFLLAVMYIQKRRLPSGYVLFFSLFLSLFGLSNYINHLELWEVISTYKSFILLLLIIDFYRFELATFISVLYGYLEVIIYSNFFTLLLFPHGFIRRYTEAYGYTQEWLLGARNDFIRYFLPALLIIILYRLLTSNILRTNLFISVIFFSLFLQNSATGIVTIVLYFILINIKFLKFLLSATRSTIIIWGSFFFIVILRSYNFLEPIIVGILGKSLDFSNRTVIWDNALSHIQVRLFQGYGILDLSSMVSMLGSFPSGFIWKGATHAHNHFLQLLLQGGIPLLLIFGIMMYISMFRARYFVNSRVIIAASLVLGVSMLTEVFNDPLMYMILFLSFYLSDSNDSFEMLGAGV